MTEMSTTPEPTMLPVTTRLEKDVLVALAERAERADRTIAAELRRAVRFYLAEIGEGDEAAAA